MVNPVREREALEQAIARGSELLKQNKLDQAQRAFRAALEIDPNNLKVIALLGLSHFRASQFDDARPIYEDLVERSPTDASHRLNLGLVYLKLNDAGRAISALEASRALDPSQGRAVSYLGLAYARAGRYAEAYRSFLLAGQNELAAEITVNLTDAERTGIHNQLGRTPSGPIQLPVPTATAEAVTAPSPAAASDPAAIEKFETVTPVVPVPAVSRAPTPISSPPAAVVAASRTTTGRAITPHVIPRGSTPPLGSEVPTSRTISEPRTRPPTAPPRSRSQEMAAMSHPEITIEGNAADAVVSEVPLEETPVMTVSQQFVLPKADPAAPAPLPGQSMLSMAVAAAEPMATVPLRTITGGTPARPLSELATDELVRPDEGSDAFEISAGGALVIRVTERVLTRLDGVHVTGGDLTYEPATRRSRGHQTDEPFESGGSALHVVTGKGYLIAAPGKRTFTAVVLDDDIFYLREDLVFAFEAALRWENGNVPGLRGKLHVVQFRGDGALALRLERPLVRVKLPAQGLVFVDADRLAGWIGRVIPRAVVPPSGGPMGTMCVECTGEGVVLVEPAPEPPAAAVAAAPVAEAAPTEPAAEPALEPGAPADIPELADLDAEGF